METPMQQQPPPSADRDDKFPDVEIYKAQMSQLELRAGFQNKCVEMSLHITTGLVGAAAVAVIAAFANDKFDFAKLRLPIALVFSLYGIIQLLILSNYIYQTFMMQGASHVYRGVTVRSFGKVLSFGVEDKLPKDEQAEGEQAKRALIRFIGKVKKLQPAIIYVSAALGGLLALASCLLPPPLPCWAIVISIVVFLFWCCVVWYFYKQHKRVLEPDIGKFVVEELIKPATPRC
jgi:hypothetical protein